MNIHGAMETNSGASASFSRFRPAGGFSASEGTRPWNFEPCFRKEKMFSTKKQENSLEPRYTKYEPVMLDMAPFGSKQLSCTKYQESGLPFLSYLPLLAIDQIIKV